MELLKKWWFLILVTALALLLRTYKISEIPASLYYDEVDLGYQVRSLLETGKDYRNTVSPFFVRSFNTDKTPLPVILSIPGVVFSSPELQVRVMTALAGVGVVLLAGLLIFTLTKSKGAAVITAFVFATNPWLIHFSRIAFEAIWVLLFYFGFLICFFLWLRNRSVKYFYLWIVLLSFNVYVYRVMSLYTPLTFLLVGLIFFKEIWTVGKKHLVAGGLTAAMIVLPFLYATTIASADQTRIEQVSIFSDPLVPIFVLRNREIDSGDYKDDQVGRKAIWSSFLFHSKPVSWLSALKSNYLKAYSTEFLFIEGDRNLRQAVGKHGELFVIDIIGLLAGGWFLIKNLKDKRYRLILAIFLTAPLPANLTFDGAGHASRLIVFALPLLLLVGLGWWRVLFSLARKKMFLWRGLLLCLVLVWLVGFINYAHKYLVHFPLESAKSHSFGYKEAVEKIGELDGRFTKIILSNTNEAHVMLHYLFWARVSPKEVQEYGPEFGPEIVKGKRLDKYKVMSWSKVVEGYDLPYEMALAMETETLYMVTQNDVQADWRQVTPPKGIKIWEMIPLPDRTEIAFYLISRDEEALQATK